MEVDRDNSNGPRTVDTQTEADSRFYSKKWSPGNFNKYKKGPEERAQAHERARKVYEEGPLNSGSGFSNPDEKKTESEGAQEKPFSTEDYEYQSDIKETDEVFNVLKKDNIHQEN